MIRSDWQRLHCELSAVEPVSLFPMLHMNQYSSYMSHIYPSSYRVIRVSVEMSVEEKKLKSFYLYSTPTKKSEKLFLTAQLHKLTIVDNTYTFYL